MELYTKEPNDDCWDTQPFEDYVAMRLHESSVINQWIQEAGEAHDWNGQIRALQQEGYLTGDNTSYDENLS
jgi:hypothetical protein